MKTLLKILVIILFIPGFIIAFIVAIALFLYSIWIEFGWMLGKDLSEDVILKTHTLLNEGKTQRQNEQRTKI